MPQEGAVHPIKASSSDYCIRLRDRLAVRWRGASAPRDLTCSMKARSFGKT
jgi:hypothetical protein